MKIGNLFILLLLGSGLAWAQTETLTLDDLLQSGQQWLEENVDENALRLLEKVDPDKAQQVLNQVRQRLQGEYVIDLAQLKSTVNSLLPWLDAYEETQPYAAWLRTRLDYFEVADELRLTIQPPKLKPGKAPAPVANPSPEIQRKVWRKQLEKRPQPKGADRYVPQLKAIFKSRQVPPELVWLAEVESSFNPQARSPAGAVGLFQLMPPTAEQLGLALRPKDERLQPDKNGQAAAQYLKYLHGRFKDWPLALAAYNAGEGRIGTLLARAKVKSFDQIARQLPAETQMYVPKIDATLQRREGISLARLPAPGQKR